MEYIEKPNLFFVYDAKAEVQKRICSGQFTIVDDDFATLGFKCGVDYVVNIINEAEVKDVKPVIHAHAEHVETDGSEELHSHWYRCSECKHPLDKWDNYCKHCGAKMDEEVLE